MDAIATVRPELAAITSVEGTPASCMVSVSFQYGAETRSEAGAGETIFDAISMVFAKIFGITVEIRDVIDISYCPWRIDAYRATVAFVCDGDAYELQGQRDSFAGAVVSACWPIAVKKAAKVNGTAVSRGKQ